MKIQFLADCHIGNAKTLSGPSNAGINRRCEHTLKSLEIALQEEADVTIILGDLFDSDRPSPTLIARVQSLIRGTDRDVHVLVGNHDMSSGAKEHNACAPLGSVGTVYERPGLFYVSDEGGAGTAEILMVPYQAGPPVAWLPHALCSYGLEMPGDRTRILCLHLGISDDETAAYLKDAEDQISEGDLFELMDEFHIDVTFAGNWHEKRSWFAQNHSEIHQVGSLIATGFNNPGAEDYGWSAVYDTVYATKKSTRIPGPRFLKIDDTKPKPICPSPEKREDLIVELLASTESRDKVYISVDTRPSRHDEWLEYLAAWREDGLIVDGRVKGDKSALQGAADAAAEEAIESESLDDAIDGYIDVMPVQEGVERREIKRIVKEAL